MHSFVFNPNYYAGIVLHCLVNRRSWFPRLIHLLVMYLKSLKVQYVSFPSLKQNNCTDVYVSLSGVIDAGSKNKYTQLVSHYSKAMYCHKMQMYLRVRFFLFFLFFRLYSSYFQSVQGRIFLRFLSKLLLCVTFNEYF